ncbi:MAG: 50S ribosomal protein L13 [bacterium]|nr:50S ribosomal protein L13 [bacterium]
MQKSFYERKEDVKRGWVLFDLKDRILGRAATEIATILRGRNKPTFTPSTDGGDFVVVINAAGVRLTGDKWKKKTYYHHTGYIGGIKEVTAEKLFQKKPEEIIRRAVRGMLPKNKSNQHLMTKLKIYAGAEHPHAAQFAKPREAAKKETKE